MEVVHMHLQNSTQPDDDWSVLKRKVIHYCGELQTYMRNCWTNEAYVV